MKGGMGYGLLYHQEYHFHSQVSLIITYNGHTCDSFIYIKCMHTCILGWVDFLQKHASYCGNLGMTHKDEK